MISSAIHGWSARRLPTAPMAVRNAENGGQLGAEPLPLLRYRKSATAVRRVTDAPTVLPSSIFDFVLGTSPSWSSKVCTLHGRTLYKKPRGEIFTFGSLNFVVKSGSDTLGASFSPALAV